MNETILKRIGALLSVKSIVTLLLSGVFAYLAIAEKVSQEFMMVYTVIIAFYFGTQTQKIQEVVARDNDERTPSNVTYNYFTPDETEGEQK